MPDTSPIASADSEDLGSSDAGGKQAETSEAPGSSTLFDEVAKIVKVIRPAIQADQGDIFLKAVDAETGVVSVELVGACISCPASTQTLKQGLERILKQRVEGVTEVRHVGEPLAGADDGTAVSL